MSSSQYRMPKGRSGLRNRTRKGRSTYSKKQKSKSADRYGSYYAGKQTGTDLIGGHSLPPHKSKIGDFADG